MLINLCDFEPAEARVPYEELPELDLWALMRLEELKTKVRRAYEEFEFHAIYHALNNFCSVDLSAVYLDILKDRLYTFRADSPLRQGSQTVLYEIILAMTKLMAPILSFTAEEIWRSMVTQFGGALGADSVHLSQFPEAHPEWQDSLLRQRWDHLLEIRVAVQAALEEQRRNKVIGSSLEADVEIQANPERHRFLTNYETELSTLFIVSRVTLKEVHHLALKPDFVVTVSKSMSAKCERCWNYREAVGTNAAHPTLCDRCVEALQ
jgi:isoleucyl-tRNA synthetase